MKRTPLLRRTALKRSQIRPKPARRGAMDPAFRAEVMGRDNYHCQASVVGMTRISSCVPTLHAHHRVLVTKVDELWNVVCVCLACHSFIHTHPGLAHCYGLIIPRSCEQMHNVLPELNDRLVEYRRGLTDRPPRAPWVTDRDIKAAVCADLRWHDARPL